MPRTQKPRSTRQKVSPALKGFTDARRSNTLLLGDIQKHIVAYAMEHGEDDREKHKLHVSDVVKRDWCPRQSWYKLSGTVPTDTDNSINHRSETFFDTGHEAHAKWQNWLWRMGILWGSWRCLVCGHEWEAESPKECPRDLCQSTALKYLEVTFEDLEYRIVGHGDGAHLELHAVLEFKGIGNGTVRIDDPEIFRKATVKTEDGRSIVDVEKMWKLISRPLKSHLLQVQFYLWMCNRQGLPFDRIIFIYESKANQATKEFVVPFTPRLIEPLLARVKEVVEAAERGEIPDRPEGLEIDRPPCKTCVFRSECYGIRKEPVDDTSETPGEDGRVLPGRRIARRKEKTGAAEDLPAPTSVESVPTDSGRHHRVGRRKADAAVHSADPARGVPECEPSVC